MAEPRRRSAGALIPALVISVTIALAGCGSGSGASTASSTDAGSTSTGQSPPPAAGAGELTPAALQTSLAPNALAFASRQGTVLRRSVERSLGKGAAIAVKPGSTECRPASATPSDSAPARYPFACVVEGVAAAGGVSTTFALGFVVFSVHGLCWKASNERIEVASGPPILLPKKQALDPVNVISGCARS